MGWRERRWFFLRAEIDYMDEERVLAWDAARRERVVETDSRYNKPSEVQSALVFPLDSDKNPKDPSS